MSDRFIPSPTTKDLSLLDPELHNLIKAFPDTIESAKTADIVVNWMRAVPVQPHEDPEITKIDLYVSTEDAKPDQPPTNVRLYIPKRAAAKGKIPVVIWSHHGGFFSAGPSRLDLFCSALAVGAGVILAAPAYRQTPENPYPAPYNDVYQLLLWLAESEETAQYFIDPTRIAIGGTSAGATLAFGLYLKYRDEKHDTSKIRLLLLEDGSYTDKSSSYSTYHNPINKIWNANVTRYMWELYLPGGSEALESKERGYVVPALAEDLTNIPPTLLLTAQWDDLTNDAIAFAHRLLEAGVPTEIHNYRGTFHVSDKIVFKTKAAKRKREDIIDALKFAFGITDEEN